MNDILRVDDDPSIREMLGIHFDLAKYSFREAADGREAMAMFAEKIPDVVILDIMMPVMDGLEVCRRIRENPRFAQSYIIILSARDSVKDKVTGLDLGADAYITKPFNTDELMAQVRVGSRIFWDRQSAMMDPLTNLFNRRTFDAFLVMEVARATRYDHALSLIIIDIDQLQEITVQHGEPAIDEVMGSMADIFREVSHESDLTSHWIGERFAWLLPETDLNGATTAADQLIAAVREFEFPHISNLNISLGAAQHQPGETSFQFLGRADNAVYDAKNQGSNQFIAAS